MTETTQTPTPTASEAISAPPSPPSQILPLKLTTAQFEIYITEEKKRTAAYETALAQHQALVQQQAAIQKAVLIESHKLLRYQAENMMTPRAHVVLALLSARMAAFGTQAESVDDVTRDLLSTVDQIMGQLFLQTQIPPQTPLAPTPPAV